MNKRKTPPTNLLVRAWNEFLFTRSFEFETSLAPEELADDLMTLREQGSRNIFAFMPLSRTVDVKYEGQGAYHFDLRHKRRNRQIDYTMAKAVGEMRHANGRTIIRGEVKFGAFYHTMMLTLAVFSVVFLSLFTALTSAFSPYPGWIMPIQTLVIVGFLLFGWWRMYQDREALMTLLEATITVEKRKRAAEARLSESSTDAEAAYVDAEDVAQARSRKR